MKLAIFGTGNVGRTLGRRFAEVGHSIRYGTRSLEDRAVLEGHPGEASLHSPVEAVKGADVLFLAVPFAAVAELAKTLGSLEGRIVVDCTNPIAPGMAGLLMGNTDSGGETVARLFPGAHVVKAFHTVGVEIMAAPRFGDRSAVLTVAGDQKEAVATIMGLAEAIGFEPLAVGPLKAARLTEPFALLWIHQAYVQQFGRQFAFTLLRR